MSWQAKRVLHQGSLSIFKEQFIRAVPIHAATLDKVSEYRGGKDKLFGFFVGQVMKAMAGKASPEVVNDLLRKALG